MSSAQIEHIHMVIYTPVTSLQSRKDTSLKLSSWDVKDGLEYVLTFLLGVEDVATTPPKKLSSLQTVKIQCKFMLHL